MSAFPDSRMMDTADPRASASVGRRWVVAGRVQGVGFRHHVWTAAQRLRVRGEVRNLSDGRVEILAHGSPAALGELLEAVRQGPRWSRVEAIEESVPPSGASFADFSVR